MVQCKNRYVKKRMHFLTETNEDTRHAIIRHVIKCPQVRAQQIYLSSVILKLEQVQLKRNASPLQLQKYVQILLQKLMSFESNP